MAESAPHGRPQEISVATAKPKSYPHLLCKSILVLLVLIAIPLFPSQAPDFITYSLFSKFWELFHLLFIGLALCYGLFSRRNVELEFEPPHPSAFDDSQSSYVSRIFHVSPIFEDGYQNPCGSHEQSSISHYYQGESIGNVSKDGSDLDEVNNKAGSLNPDNGCEISFEQEEHVMMQTWNFQFSQVESPVILSQADYEPYKDGKLGHVNGHKPLGLPVRSLKSLTRDLDSVQFANGIDSCASSRGSSGSSGRSVEEKFFGNVDPVNLEQKFDESIASASQIPWCSASMRIDARENMGFPAGRASHFRPLSVDETQFECLRSQSFSSTASFSTQVTSMSNSPTVLSPSHSVSSDVPNSEAEEVEEQKGYPASYPPASQSVSTKANGEVRLNAFHLRRYSSGSLFQNDLKGRLKDESKDSGGKNKEGSVSNKESSLKSDRKPATLVKPSSKGKSVRTIRSSGYIEEALKARRMSKSHIHSNVGKTTENESNLLPRRPDDMKGGCLDNISNGSTKKYVDTQRQIPKPTFTKHQKEMEESFKSVTLESEEDSESEISKLRVISEEQAVADAGHDPSEVDKKAGEFIAKFREQIRLQKVASMEKSRRRRSNSNQFR